MRETNKQQRMNKNTQQEQQPEPTETSSCLCGGEQSLQCRRHAYIFLKYL